MPLNAADFIEDLPPALQKRFESFCNEIVTEHQKIRANNAAGNRNDPFIDNNCLIGCLGEDRSSPRIFIVAPDKFEDFVSKNRLSASAYVRTLKAIEEYKANPSGLAYSGLIAEAALELLSGSNAADNFGPILCEVNSAETLRQRAPSNLSAIFSMLGILSAIAGIISLFLDVTDFGAWIALAIGMIVIWRTRMA